MYVRQVLRDELKNIHVMVTSDYSPDLAEALIRGRLDVAFMRTEPNFELVYEVVDHEPLIVLMPSDHRLTSREAIRDEVGKALVKELRSLGSEAEFINADVRAMVDKTVARFGRLDVAVNNAATEGDRGLITDQTPESFAATFETNVLGVVLSMKHEVRAMQAQGSGSIINISSTYGHEGAAGASLYVGAKHAVEGVTKSVALEVAKSGIRVNAVAPGPTDTGMLTRFTETAENKAVLMRQVPLGRLGLSEEVADGIVFIGSDEARFITGHVLNVDGGHSAN
ncbi:MAG: hypothetical protein QOI59_541 [Gammaproteobacteria bacterium]|jgi:NAD(P)-dependent dehydrogenase (short-subunit alcohol dehydrogenase family)|nr:hypothetical protein [Gammaproteobacteria bacterium]